MSAADMMIRSSRRCFLVASKWPRVISVSLRDLGMEIPETTLLCDKRGGSDISQTRHLFRRRVWGSGSIGHDADRGRRVRGPKQHGVVRILLCSAGASLMLTDTPSGACQSLG
jgi:hypothetical protein